MVSRNGMAHLSLTHSQCTGSPQPSLHNGTPLTAATLTHIYLDTGADQTRGSSYRQTDAHAELLKQVLPCESQRLPKMLKKKKNPPSQMSHPPSGSHTDTFKETLCFLHLSFFSLPAERVSHVHIYPAEPSCLGSPLATPDCAPISCGPWESPAALGPHFFHWQNTESQPCFMLTW